MMIITICTILYLGGALGFAAGLIARGKSHHEGLILPRNKIVVWGALWLPILIWLPVALLLGRLERARRSKVAP